MLKIPARIVRIAAQPIFNTTGIAAQVGPVSGAWFFTGQNHAGENLNPRLKRRAADLTQPMQMLDPKKVEPNSGLGEAINYMLKRWETLTRFLSVPGAPLDHNITERAIKTAIRHRKNSLSYKTLAGARVGDIHMSLIHTCELNRINPFDYLMALEQHAEAVAKAPTGWFPWNYRQAIEAVNSA